MSISLITDGSTGEKSQWKTKKGRVVKDVILTVRHQKLNPSILEGKVDENGKPVKTLPVYLQLAITECRRMFLSVFDDIKDNNTVASWTEPRQYPLPFREGSSNISIWNFDGIKIAKKHGKGWDIFKLTMDDQITPQEALDLFWANVFSFDQMIEDELENNSKNKEKENKKKSTKTSNGIATLKYQDEISKLKDGILFTIPVERITKQNNMWYFHGKFKNGDMAGINDVNTPFIYFESESESDIASQLPGEFMQDGDYLDGKWMMTAIIHIDDNLLTFDVKNLQVVEE